MGEMFGVEKEFEEGKVGETRERWRREGKGKVEIGRGKWVKKVWRQS